jgi:prophage tail gpP-like protein
MSNIRVDNVSAGKELLWRSIKIRKSLDEICHTLELELPPTERLKVRKHNKITVNCENPLIKNSGGTGLITTVLVDEITASVDVTSHNITVVGRSPARDIIDSSWDDEDRDKDRTLRTIAQQIGIKFNIACDTFPPNSPDPTGIVHSFSFENESPWTKLIAAADSQGYIFTSNQAGGLYLWKVQTGLRREGFHITEGKNVQSIRWTENGS